MNISLGQTYSFQQLGKRNNQEDARFPDNDMPSKKQRFFVVCDGVGGSNCGEVASLTVCESFAESLDDYDFSQDFTNESFGRMLGIAYNALDKVADNGNEDMATTLTFAAFHGGGVTLAHIGDSRVYQIRPSQGIVYRSDDHSLVNQMIHSGLISPDDALSHPQRNVITRYMGPTFDKQNRCSATVMRTCDIEKGDFFLLCTDGVTNKIQEEELVAIISDSSSTKEKMSRLSLICKDSSDNNTAILIPITSVEDNKYSESADRVEASDKTLRNSERQRTIEEVEPIITKTNSNIFSIMKENINKIYENMKEKLTVIFVMTLLVCSSQSFAQKQRNAKSQKENVTTAMTDSVNAIKQKAEAGDSNAQNTLGTWYYTGKNVKQNDETALKWWAKSSDKGNTDAIANMAMCYQLGRGVSSDSVMAMKLYKAAVQKGNKVVIPQHEAIVKKSGNLFSSRMLYDFYANGIGVKQDRVKATSYLKNLAEAGNADCQYKLALYYLNNKQADIAVRWFKEASLKGFVGAVYYYGFLLHQGMGVQQDKTRGISLMEMASAKGFAMADYQLGKIYYDGNGAEQDYEKAVNHLKKATASNADARWLLGICYMEGLGVPKDYYFATQYIVEAKIGHLKEVENLLKEQKEEQYMQYLSGLKAYKIEKDYAKALDCFNKVSKAKVIDGETMKGVVLADTAYDKNNPKKAVKILAKAAETSPVANYYLSKMYEKGKGVEKDDAKAVELLQKAADSGVASAQCSLGDRYMTGEGVAQDYVKAVQLYLRAEKQNQLTPSSANNLAKCYEMRIAGIPDLEKSDVRIKQLKGKKANENLIRFLKVLSL